MKLLLKSVHCISLYKKIRYTADQIKENTTTSPRFWVFYLNYSGTPLESLAPAPSGSGVSYATAWQLVQNKYITIDGYKLKVDISSSTSSNPANYYT